MRRDRPINPRNKFPASEAQLLNENSALPSIAAEGSCRIRLSSGCAGGGRGAGEEAVEGNTDGTELVCAGTSGAEALVESAKIGGDVGCANEVTVVALVLASSAAIAEELFGSGDDEGD